MRLMRGRNGQSTAEYAVLFALIIGSAIAVQQYVKFRLQGAVKGATDAYTTTIESQNSGLTVTPWSPTREVTGSNKSDSQMENASKGVVNSVGGGQTTQAVN